MRVALADDDVLLREGLASLFDRSGFEVVGQASDGQQLLQLVRQTLPDLVVADIRMPPSYTTEGLQAAMEIRAERPATAILLLSAYVDVEHAMELLASGRAIGYLLKRRVTNVEDFLDTVHRVAEGGSVVDPALVQELVTARRRDDPLAVLSSREVEVLTLMAEGRSNGGIARRLWVTEGTVEKHVRSILTKLRLPEAEDDHRRVMAVLTFLEARLPRAPRSPNAAESGANATKRYFALTLFPLAGRPGLRVAGRSERGLAAMPRGGLHRKIDSRKHTTPPAVRASGSRTHTSRSRHGGY